MHFYAVSVGRQPGIYDEWAMCARQVLNYRGGSFRKFRTVDDAERYLQNHTALTCVPRYLSASDDDDNGIRVSDRVPDRMPDRVPDPIGPSPPPSQPPSKTVALWRQPLVTTPVVASASVPRTNRVYPCSSWPNQPRDCTPPRVGVNPHDHHTGHRFVYIDAAMSVSDSSSTGGRRAGVGIYIDDHDCRNRSMSIEVTTDHPCEGLLRGLIELHHLIRTDLDNQLRIVVVCTSTRVVRYLLQGAPPPPPTRHRSQLRTGHARTQRLLHNLARRTHRLYRKHHTVQFMDLRPTTTTTDAANGRYGTHVKLHHKATQYAHLAIGVVVRSLSLS